MIDTLAEFFNAWGEADPAAREAALDRALATPFSYCDPNTRHEIDDLGQLSDYLSAFTARMPGAKAQMRSCDTHHQSARAVVDFTMGERAMMRGQYFAVLDDTGRITRMAGFNGTGETT